MVREEKITRSPLRQRHLRMLVLGDARERRARLALAAGAERHHLVGRQMAVGVDARGTPARRRDSRSRARPARRAPWRGRPPRPRGRQARAASATARMRATLEAKVVTRDARRARSGSVRPASWRRRLPTASGPRAPHWWNRRSARGSPRRRARAASPRRSAGRAPGSDRSSSRRCAARCRCGVRMISAFDSGIECATETSSMSNGPTREAAAERHDGDRNVRRAGLAQALGLEQRRGERRRIDRHLQLAATDRAARRNGPRAHA